MRSRSTAFIVACGGFALFATLSAPGCGGGASAGSVPMLQNAPSPPPGAMTSESYQKANKAKNARAGRR